MSWLSQGLGVANNFLGSGVGGLAGGAVSGLFSNFLGRKAAQDNRKDLLGMGLTPWEIAGSGGAAGQGRSSNVLGSGPAQQAARQHQFQASERAKDRALEKYKVDKTTAAPMGQLELSRDKHPVQIRGMEQDIAVKRMDEILKGRQGDLIREQTRLAKVNADHFWPILTAKMGAENVFVALQLALEGLNVENILKQQAGSDEEKAAILRAINAVVAKTSATYINTKAVQMLSKELEGDFGPLSTPDGLQSLGKKLEIKGRNVWSRHKKFYDSTAIGKRYKDMKEWRERQ